jgi:cytochrome c oxidase assembly factor CtaG
VWETTPELVSIFWRFAPMIVVIFLALVRFLFYANRRRDADYQRWEPVEVMIIRSLVSLGTGKPMTKHTWKMVDLIVVILLALAIAAWVFDERTGGRHRSPLRRFFGDRSDSPSSSNNRK